MGVRGNTAEAASGLAHIVREAIADQNRDGHDELLEAALARAGETALPHSLEDMLVFVCGPLYEAALARWNAESADALLAALTPLLEAAWERDRRAIATLETDRPVSEDQPIDREPQRRSAVRRAVALPVAEEEGRAQADTEPAPPPSISSDAPASQKRTTVPYTPAVWTRSRKRVLVVALDDERRVALAELSRRPGLEVVTAADLDEARMLYQRLRPMIVVADRESIAPDFEPLRPTFEGLFGSQAPCDVILLTDDPPREEVDHIAAVLPERPAKDELQAQIGLLLESE
jgi:hypothetical protein